MRFLVSKNEVFDRYGNVVVIGAVIEPFKLEKIDWVRANRDDGSKKTLAKLVELYILDGTNSFHETIFSVYYKLESRIARFCENMLTLDLGTREGLHLLESFFAKIRRLGANKKRFCNLRDFLSHYAVEFGPSLRYEAQQNVIVDDILGEDGYIKASGHSGRGTDSCLAMRGSGLYINIQNKTSDRRCRNTFNHTMISRSSYDLLIYS